MNLAKVLKEYRWAVKADVRTLANQIGVNASCLNRFERGEKDISGKNLAVILRWLLDEEDDA